MSKVKNWLLARLGIYREFLQYLASIRHVGIEIFYGEGIVFFGFAIYSYVYSISLYSVLGFFGAACLLAGYHIWRTDHLRLFPCLRFHDPPFRCNHPVTTDNPNIQRL